MNPVKKLMSEGKLKKALELFMQIAEEANRDDLVDSLIHQMSRYSQNEDKNNAGLLDDLTHQRTNNKINYALTQLIDEYEDEIQWPETTSADIVDAVAPSSSNKISKILFLASNPMTTGKLELEKEHSRISRKLQDASSDIRLKMIDKLTFTNFLESIVNEKPDIIHFSGHGQRGGAEISQIIERSRSLDLDDMSEPLGQDESGIILYDEESQEGMLVRTPVIERLFKTLVNLDKLPIRVVFFNSCFSEAQAQAVAKYVPHVIGTSWAIKDKAAIAFSTGFYFGIAQGKDIPNAVAYGIIQAMNYDSPDKFIYYQNGARVDL